MKEWSFIQAVSVDGQDIPMESLVSCAYIETGDVSGPKMILSLMDQISYFRDEVGIKKGSEVEITMGDIAAENDDLWIETFIVVKPVTAGGILTLEGFAKVASNMKKLVNKPRFFVNKSPADILKTLVPGVKFDVDSFPVATYHLNPGMTVSRLIRTIARDCGAMCWYARGTLYFKAIKALVASPAVATIEANRNAAGINIERYSIPGEAELYERILEKSYSRWDTVAGIEKSSKYSDKTPTLISVPAAVALNNQSVGMVPEVIVETLGNNAFTPGINLEVLFHKFLPEESFDESIPEKQTVYQVTHFQHGNRYNCKMELVTPHE